MGQEGWMRSGTYARGCIGCLGAVPTAYPGARLGPVALYVLAAVAEDAELAAAAGDMGSDVGPSVRGLTGARA